MLFLTSLSLLVLAVFTLEPRDVPYFRIDFDLPASQRYQEVYHHFGETIAHMEDYFYESLPPVMRAFYADPDNMLAFRQAQPDVYEAMVALSEVINRNITQTVTVNQITEFSTYCTSIVARNEAGEISHVRNLDFSATALMKQLVYVAVLVKDGEERAQAPCIAGYYGSYTGHKPDRFSVSYNVRETVVYPSMDMIFSNLERSIDSAYTPLWGLIQDLLLAQDTTFASAVEELSTRNVTSPGYVIVGGLRGNEGVVIARDAVGTNHTRWLTEDSWYVV